MHSLDCFQMKYTFIPIKVTKVIQSTAVRDFYFIVVWLILIKTAGNFWMPSHKDSTLYRSNILVRFLSTVYVHFRHKWLRLLANRWSLWHMWNESLFDIVFILCW